MEFNYRLKTAQRKLKPIYLELQASTKVELPSSEVSLPHEGEKVKVQVSAPDFLSKYLEKSSSISEPSSLNDILLADTLAQLTSSTGLGQPLDISLPPDIETIERTERMKPKIKKPVEKSSFGNPEMFDERLFNAVAHVVDEKIAAETKPEKPTKKPSLLQSQRVSMQVIERPLSWTRKLIEEAFDLRLECLSKEITHVKPTIEPFDQFVFRFLTKKFGLPSLVEKTASELVKAISIYQDVCPLVELFKSFLKGDTYGHEDLVFLLYLRKELAKCTLSMRVALSDDDAHLKKPSSFRRYKTIKYIELPRHFPILSRVFHQYSVKDVLHNLLEAPIWTKAKRMGLSGTKVRSSGSMSSPGTMASFFFAPFSRTSSSAQCSISTTASTSGSVPGVLPPS
ncbi:hypothetical protein ADUPG1_007406, partial [Aduncisulcus paluster]